MFLFNLGVHYSISLNFTTFRDLVDSVIMLLRRKIDVQHNNKPIVIWKTTSSIEKEKTSPKNLTRWRFHTRQVSASSPVGRDHWGIFELIIRKVHHSPLALYARSHHPSLALLACSRVPQSPLNPGKAVEEAGQV